MSIPARLLAVLDVGKTHTRLRLIDPAVDTEVWRRQRVNQSVKGLPVRQLDVAHIEQWLIESLKAAPRRGEICAIVPIAHGAAAVLIGNTGEILAAPDYEDPCFERVNTEYESERDPFTSTYSPSLPLGLNLGRQLFYLERREPQLFDEAAVILPYAQFWAWRLCGVMASEVTTLGCHSDLWIPAESRFSHLARRRGWSQRFPPLHGAADALGPIRPELAKATGLSADCRVHCGIHDSNASYLRHLLSRRNRRFAVVSSGTWTVVMTNRAQLSVLNERRDMLANVDLFGSPVATARFMGGREYEAIAQTTAQPNITALRSVLQQGSMALPSFAPGGPFHARRSQLLKVNGLTETERASLATLYVALMTDFALEVLGADGDVIVDGPLAGNSLFASVLAALRGSERVWIDDGRCTGAAIGYLGGVPSTTAQALNAVSPVSIETLFAYRPDWRQQVEAK